MIDRLAGYLFDFLDLLSGALGTFVPDNAPTWIVAVAVVGFMAVGALIALAVIAALRALVLATVRGIRWFGEAGRPARAAAWQARGEAFEAMRRTDRIPALDVYA